MTVRIVSKQIQFATPWFEIVAKKLSGESAPHYALRMPDYVSIVAFTENDELILVRQFRPAIERSTLELPSGHVDEGETPAESARRELAEETGFNALNVELLGTLLSDTGRHENRLWCYGARGATRVEPQHPSESGLELVLVPRAGIPNLIKNREFDHALHLAVLMLAIVQHGPDLFALK